MKIDLISKRHRFVTGAFFNSVPYSLLNSFPNQINIPCSEGDNNGIFI